MPRFECRVTPGVTAVIGKGWTGKSTELCKRIDGEPARWLVYDSQGSAAFDSFARLESVADAFEFLSGEGSAGASWVRVVRLDSVTAYEVLTQTVQHWRGVRWVVDDAGRLIGSKIIREAMEDVATTGRHKAEGAGVELWVACHRATELSTSIRAQLDRVLAFYQDDPDAIAKLAERCGASFTDKLSNLSVGQFVEWPDRSSVKLLTGRRGAKRKVTA